MRKFHQSLALIALAAVAGLAQAQATRVVGSIITQNLVPAGTATANSCVEIDPTNKGVIGVGVSGTYTGALSAQATVTGSLWTTLGPTPFAPAGALGTPTATISSAATGNWQVSAVPGWVKFRVCGLAAMSGTAVVTLNSSPASIGSSSSGGGGGGGAITAASGSYASGAISSGAFAAGSLASGAGVDGWDLTQGAKADAVCGTDTGTCSVTSLLKKANANLTTLAGTNTDLTAVQTPVAPAAATATKANLAGLQYNSTPPTFTNGQQGSLQGDANGYLKVNVAAGSSSGTVAQASTTSGQSGMLVQGAVTTSAPSYTTAQTSPLSLDTAGNLRVSGSFSALDMSAINGTCSASCINNPLVSWDTTGYQSAEIQITAQGTGATFAFQCSSDNTTWSSCNAMSPGSTGSSGVSQSSTGVVGQWCMPVYARYQRVYMSGYGSGTITIVGYQRSKSNCGGLAININSQATLVANVQGQNAQGGSPSNPLATGVEARTSAPTATTNAQQTRVVGTVYGSPVVLPYSIPELTWQYAAAASGIVNTTTAVSMVSGGGASVRNYVTGCAVQTATLGGATELVIQDSTPTVLFRTQLQTTALPITHIPFPVPLRPALNTAIQAATLTAVTGGVYVNCQGYTAP
jgi:hypothetical protein